MDFQLLGPVEARDGTRRVALSGTKVHTVLAALLLARGRVVSDERLSSLLWGWEPPATRSAQIYTYVSRLRKLLGPSVELVRRQPGYQLVGDGMLTDVEEFERLGRLGQCALRERRYGSAARALRSALDLWQGPALANVTPFLAEAELPRLEEARITVLENRIEADLALGRHQQLVPELTGIVREFPVRERLRAQLMTALYRSGRQADALHVYHEGRSVLSEELGVDPGEELTAVHQSVLTGELARFPGPDGGPVTGSGEPPRMLPATIDDFTGRGAELAGLRKLLAPDESSGFRPSRLLISGMVGVGKTALAVHAAHEVAHAFPDGQLYARLCRDDGTPKDPARVLAQLLRALGEPLADTPPVGGGAGAEGRLDELVQLYRNRTAGRRLLIVLDNAVSGLQLDLLMPSSARSAVLVTSRRRLTAVPGSHSTTLAPLPAEEAAALLAAVAGKDRAAAEPAAFREVARYCAGLPLAVRTAGARLAARPHRPAAVLARRLADPDTRLAELRFGGLDVQRAVHGALREARPGTHRLLRRLARFGERAFPLGASVTVLGLPLPVAEEFLDELVDASLLHAAGADLLGLPRYRWHELVRLALAALPTGCGEELERAC
ncbi:BTAD domain-containing putative transcriptional regulator [Streptomyces sp. NPDC004609]|uniref:AfsR/SARP family transcriptional regulator n=1 Tax=Streptomyces sp. NPDC004609 TaxID=3364704 RepID=UPI003676E832